MYHNELMEHFKYPYNRNKVKNANFSYHQDNPSCGDQVSIEGIIAHNQIEAIGFEGKGCVISQATASMLTEKCKDLSLDEIIQLKAEDIINLIGIELGPNRLKCALISLDALKRGINIYLTNKQ